MCDFCGCDDEGYPGLGEEPTSVPNPSPEFDGDEGYPPMSAEAMRYKDGPSPRETPPGTPDYPDAEQWAERKAAEKAAAEAGDTDYRSAVSGQYVTAEYAKANPDTTIAERG